jgi:hypothetical protein
MDTRDEGLFPYDLVLDQTTCYFLYVGEARYDTLNQFMCEALERRTGRRMDCIRIIPDVSGCALPRNTLVLNPRAKARLARTGVLSRCPVRPREFAAAVSASPTVRELARSLVARQGELFVHVAESVPELTINRLPGVRLIGPDGETAAMWSNRLYQMRLLKDLAPVLEHRLCRCAEELAEAVETLLPTWEDGACLLAESPFGDPGVFVVTDPRDVNTRPAETGGVLLMRNVPSRHTPTVLGITAGPDDVFVAAVADRRREPDGAFGASYPSVLAPRILTELREHARMAGRVLGGSGYRGVYGCDFVVDKNDTVHFVEINARKHGAALEMCCTLECALPTGSPTLADLELCAVFDGRLPENARELARALESLCWRTCTVRADRRLMSEASPLGRPDVRGLFKRVLSRGSDHGMIVLEHPARDCLVEPGATLGRVVAVAADPAYLAEDMALGRSLLLASFRDAPQEGP